MIGEMPLLMRLRRAVAPAPGAREGGAPLVLPARLLAWRPVVRRFSLAMPAPPAGLGQAVRPAAALAWVAIDAPWRSYVPRLLEEGGVARYGP